MSIASLILVAATSAGDSLELKIGRVEFFAIEPVLVTARLTGDVAGGLPAIPGAELKFEIEPAIKPRAKVKPLPVERAWAPRRRSGSATTTSSSGSRSPVRAAVSPSRRCWRGTGPNSFPSP